MKLLLTFFGYLKWHYGKALMAVFSFWKNILIFLFNFFSIKNLLGNFFTPWKRLADSYPKRFDIKVYFFTFLVNTIMRIVGMILRFIIIIIGLACCAAFTIFLPFALVIWLALPLIIAALIISGLYFLIIPNYKI
jgi:hypothetical protein